MNERRWNWPLWVGFLLSVFTFFSYFALFAKYPVTRDVPWVNFSLFAIAVSLLGIALKRAFGEPQIYRGKIMGPILSILGLAVAGFFCFFIFHVTRQLPVSAGAPRIGSKAPDFSLSDTQGNMVSLSSLFTNPDPSTHEVPKGVLLVFYRGYW